MKTKLARGLLFTVLALAVSQQAMAAFVLNGTRLIYNEGAKGAAVEVTNNADTAYGGQVWLSNVSQGKETVYMVPSPPFFKVSAKQKQFVRIMNVNPSLPADRESLFRLNVQEIPPVPDNKDGGAVLALAMNTQIKLLWRPKALAEGRKDAEKNLTVLRRNNTVWLKNPTPYYFAVVGLRSGGKKMRLSDAAAAALTTLAPFSEADTGLATPGDAVSVDAIDDWGGVQNYAVK